MGMTAGEKILARAAGLDTVAVGDIIFPRASRVIVHDGYLPVLRREMDELGLSRPFEPQKMMIVTDHEPSYASEAAALRGRIIRSTAEKWSVGVFHDAGRKGLGHLFPIYDGLVRPGDFVFAYDMHCMNYGAVGALGWRTGSEILQVAATGTLWTIVPPTVRITLTGQFAPGVGARDWGFEIAAMALSGRLDFEIDYRIIAFDGPGARALTLSDRIAMCNTLCELGAANIFFPPDDEVLAGLAYTMSDCSFAVVDDYDAAFESEATFDLGATEPQVVEPGGFGVSSSVSNSIGRRIDHAVIGSCGSGTFEEISSAARLLSGREVAPHVRLFVAPGTTAALRRLQDGGEASTLTAAGATLLPAGCGPCAGGIFAPLAPGETSISTISVNTEGRMGSPDADIFLASPRTVAASAIAGEIADPRTVGCAT